MAGASTTITDIRAHVLEAPLTQPFAYARAWYSTRTAVIVEIITDQGMCRRPMASGGGSCRRSM